MTPKISGRPYYKLAIPEMSGGVNFRDGVSQVLDNQLTDCGNVWYKNGLLRTRPGFKGLGQHDFVSDFLRNEDNIKIYSKKENFCIINGETYFLAAFQTKDAIRFFYIPENSMQKMITVTTINKYELPQDAEFSCNIFQHNSEIYCFCSGYYEGEQTPYYIFKIYEEDGAWKHKRITDEDIYIPTIARNCVCDRSKTPLTGGAMIEGYNLLSNKFRVYFTSVNLEMLEEGNVSETSEPAHHIYHYIPLDESVVSRVPTDLVVNITNLDGTVTRHTATMSL